MKTVKSTRFTSSPNLSADEDASLSKATLLEPRTWDSAIIAAYTKANGSTVAVHCYGHLVEASGGDTEFVEFNVVRGVQCLQDNHGPIIVDDAAKGSGGDEFVTIGGISYFVVAQSQSVEIRSNV